VGVPWACDSRRPRWADEVNVIGGALARIRRSTSRCFAVMTAADLGAGTASRSAPACQYRHVDAFKIRAATPADADAVADYHHRCFTKTYSSQLLAGELEAPDPADTRQQLHDRFLPESEFETRVAVVDGAPIGHVTVSGHYLIHLFVEPDHQNMGFGRHLLAQGEAMIAAGGHTDLELHARVDNLAAIIFYEKAGWTVTDRVIHTVEHGISYDERILIKHRA
jgi:ribosomal protein S18 acetylase RimI-like enzyme